MPIDFVNAEFRPEKFENESLIKLHGRFAGGRREMKRQLQRYVDVPLRMV
jgi:hypothetical protein